MKRLRRTDGGISGGLVASATGALHALTRMLHRAHGEQKAAAARAEDGEAAEEGPGDYALDYPLRNAVGDAELVLKRDGSWSASFTVIPVPDEGAEEAPASDPSSLPPLVSIVRGTIIKAASAGDFDVLEELAFALSDDFTYSFDEPTLGGHPSRYWRELEEQGGDVSAGMIRLLEMPHAELDDTYVWPSVAVKEWSEIASSDREALRRGFGRDQVRFWEEFGRYVGYRIGITSKGDWRFFASVD